MKKLFTLLALIALSFSSMAQWLPQNTGFTTPSRGIRYVHAVNDQIVWATAYDGSGGGAVIQEFTRTTNGGETWTPGVINNATGLDMAMIFGIDANTAYVPMFRMSGSNPQGIYKTTDGGLTWTRQTSASFSNANSFPNVVHFFDANNGFAMGDPINNEFEIYTTTDAGANWVLVPGANIPAPISGEYGTVGYYDAVGDNVWFGTTKGRVFRSHDRGYTWEVSNTSFGSTISVDVEFASPLHGLAQDKSQNTTGAFAETFDGGITWTAISANGPTLTNDFVYVPGTEDTFVATGAATGATGVAVSYDGGHNWEFFPDTETTQFLATDFVDPETGWAGGFNVSATEGGMFKFNGSLADMEAPTDLTATVNEQTVTLNWTGPAEPGATFLGYNVYRNTVNVGFVTATTFVDENLANGNYTYMVTSVYEGGESTPSNAVEVTITGGVNMTTIEMDFEDQEDFSLTFGDWTTLDVDGNPTWGIEGVEFPHQGEPMGFIAFNPEATTPPVAGMDTHGGERFGAVIASNPPANNDWLISPQIELGQNPSLSMWVKSYTAQYGLERYNVLVSTTDMNPASFELVAGPISAPADAWTLVTYELDEYIGEQVYVAIQCISNDAFIFMVDDIVISFTTASSNIPVVENLMVYPNPANGILNIKADSKFNKVQLVNLAGQVVYESSVLANETAIKTTGLSQGLYMLNITSDLGVVTRKVSIR